VIQGFFNTAKRCHQVCWRPELVENQPFVNPFYPVPTPHASALAYLGTVKTPSKPAGAYRPPGARGQVTPLHFKREDEGGAAHISGGLPSIGTVNGFGKSRRREVPGAEPASEKLPPGAAPGGGVSLTTVGEGDEGLSKAALKNKKKREAKKAKEAAEKGAAGSSAGDVFGGDGSGDVRGANVTKSPDERDRSLGRDRSRSNLEPRNNSQRRGKENPERDSSRHRRNQSSQSRGMGSNPNSAAASMTNLAISSSSNPQTAILAPPINVETSVTSPGGGSPHDKKLRGLLKKIRAIDDLKMRLAAGEKLEDTQMKKIATEDGVRRELEALGWNG
jgi:translation initiation factor 2A